MSFVKLVWLVSVRFYRFSQMFFLKLPKYLISIKSDVKSKCSSNELYRNSGRYSRKRQKREYIRCKAYLICQIWYDIIIIIIVVIIIIMIVVVVVVLIIIIIIIIINIVIILLILMISFNVFVWNRLIYPLITHILYFFPAGKLYCAGGHDGLTIFASVESYDSTLRQWRQISPMITRRCRLGLTVLNNRIFACGGYDGSSFLSSVEYYDSYNNMWIQVASMTQRRSRVSSVTLGGKIFAVGGYNGTANLSTIETYDPWTNEWSQVTEMGMHDGGVGVGVLPRVN